jgi:hypothetical protein
MSSSRKAVEVNDGDAIGGGELDEPDAARLLPVILAVRRERGRFRVEADGGKRGELLYGAAQIFGRGD